MPLKLKETYISTKLNRLKNPDWQEADQVAIYKHDQGVLNPSHFKSGGFHVRRPNQVLGHAASTLFPRYLHAASTLSRRYLHATSTLPPRYLHATSTLPPRYLHLRYS